MKTLFMEGGVLFMGMLSIVLLTVLAIAVKSIIKDDKSHSSYGKQIGYVKSLGLFALVLGFLGQFIGLFSAFSFIAQQGTVAPSILASGFKVSSIASIYGMIIFLISYLIWFGLESISKPKK